MEFLIVSGLSGAGKSQAAKYLEDLDYYCVDNMPVALLPRFAAFCAAARGRYDRVALVTDVRGQEGFEDLFSALDELKAMNFRSRILFMEAPTEVIVRRYKETRRPHPLAEDRQTIEDAVRRERELLSTVRDRADYIIDTGKTTQGQLLAEIRRLFSAGNADEEMSVNVISFGFKYGAPIEADFVFDVRFLPNPYYVPELRGMSGRDEAVETFVLSSPEAREFLHKLQDMLDYLLPLFRLEGRQLLTVAIGCTGGRHRSVAMAKALTEYLNSTGNPARGIDRDLGKGANP